jgi:hypothetical protein
MTESDIFKARSTAMALKPISSIVTTSPPFITARIINFPKACTWRGSAQTPGRRKRWDKEKNLGSNSPEALMRNVFNNEGWP